MAAAAAPLRKLDTETFWLMDYYSLRNNVNSVGEVMKILGMDSLIYVGELSEFRYHRWVAEFARQGLVFDPFTLSLSSILNRAFEEQSRIQSTSNRRFSKKWSLKLKDALSLLSSDCSVLICFDYDQFRKIYSLVHCRVISVPVFLPRPPLNQLPILSESSEKASSIAVDIWREAQQSRLVASSAYDRRRPRRYHEGFRKDRRTERVIRRGWKRKKLNVEFTDPMQMNQDRPVSAGLSRPSEMGFPMNGTVRMIDAGISNGNGSGSGTTTESSSNSRLPPMLPSSPSSVIPVSDFIVTYMLYPRHSKLDERTMHDSQFRLKDL